jgi:caa(3)-type oxidase subunit IV
MAQTTPTATAPSPEHADHDHASDRTYIMLWGVLIVALFASLGLGELGNSNAMVMLIFGIAAVKAYLVIAHYMHLKLEPLFVKLIMLGAVLVIAICYFGLVPDIVFGAGTLIEDGR